MRWVLGLVGCAAVVRAMPNRRLRVAAGVAIVAVLLAAVPRPPTVPGHCGPGIGWYPPGGDRPAVLVVGPQASAGSVATCAAAGIRSVDLATRNRAEIVKAAAGMGLPFSDESVTICGTVFQLR